MTHDITYRRHSRGPHLDAHRKAICSCGEFTSPAVDVDVAKALGAGHQRAMALKELEL